MVMLVSVMCRLWSQLLGDFLSLTDRFDVRQTYLLVTKSPVKPVAEESILLVSAVFNIFSFQFLCFSLMCRVMSRLWSRFHGGFCH